MFLDERSKSGAFDFSGTEKFNRDDFGVGHLSAGILALDICPQDFGVGHLSAGFWRWMLIAVKK
jgi:hypothetical protein